MTTWDDGIPQDFPYPIVVNPNIPDDTVFITVNGKIAKVLRFTVAKPPLDPLRAGWVTCPGCQGRKHFWRTVLEEHRSFNCQDCDGLGIVVGPPEDGLEIVDLAANSSINRDCVPLAFRARLNRICREANAYKMSS